MLKKEAYICAFYLIKLLIYKMLKHPTLSSQDLGIGVKKHFLMESSFGQIIGQELHAIILNLF